MEDVVVKPNQGAVETPAAWAPETGVGANLEVSAAPTDVHWQWKHKTGWKDYDDDTNNRIESAFQDGLGHVLCKAGRKKGTQPKELFFEDMKQFDPITSNARDIQRTGPDSCISKLRREYFRLWLYMQTGKSQRLTYKQFHHVEISVHSVHKVDPNKDLTPWFKDAEKSCLGGIARSGWFSLLSGIFIALNVAWLGIDAEHSDATSARSAWLIVGDNIFCMWFSCELIINIFAHSQILNAFKDPWYMLDLVLVFLYIFEVWIVSAYVAMTETPENPNVNHVAILRGIRVLRITRLGRITRLLRMVPGALAVAKGFIKAVQAVWFTFAVILFTTYLFGVSLLIQTSGEPLEETFPNLSTAMWRLFLHGALLDDVVSIMDTMVVESYTVTGTFTVYIVVCNMTLLNMLIGLMADVISKVADTDKDEEAAMDLKARVEDILECHDQDDCRLLYWTDFDVLAVSAALQTCLAEHEIDLGLLKSLKGLIYREHGYLPDREVRGPYDDYDDEDRQPTQLGEDELKKRVINFPAFVETVLRLRSSNSASVRDIIELRNFIMENNQDREAPQARQDGALRAAAEADCLKPAGGDVPAWAQQLVQSVKKQGEQLQALQEDVKATRKQLESMPRPT